jgi:hypothetical protein
MGKSTKYNVFTVNAEGGEELVTTKSKKATAVDAARELRKEQSVAVAVRTEAGNEVFAMPAPKKIKMSPRYTRVVDLPENAIIPEGSRVAYIRARKNLAITHNPEAEAPYSVVNFVTGEVLATDLETTRDSGAFCKTVPVPARELENA